jgi:hypothetical protein
LPSSEGTTLEIKQEPISGQGTDSDTNELDPYRDYDPNDPFDIRNSSLYTQEDVQFSSSASDSKNPPIERSVITRQDVDIIRSQASDWQTENDALMAMRHLISKDSRPNLVIHKEALASVLFQSRPPSDALSELAKAQAESFIRNAQLGGAELFAPHSGTLSQSWQFQQHTFAELFNLVLDNGILTPKQLMKTNINIISTKSIDENS